MNYTFTITATVDGATSDEAWDQWTDLLTQPRFVEDGTTVSTDEGDGIIRYPRTERIWEHPAVSEPDVEARADEGWDVAVTVRPDVFELNDIWNRLTPAAKASWVQAMQPQPADERHP